MQKIYNNIIECNKIMFETVKNKLIDKGLYEETLQYLMFVQCIVPIFDPPTYMRQHFTVKELLEQYIEYNKPLFKYQQECLINLDVWVDRQNYK